jgi:hypothetical protein
MARGRKKGNWSCVSRSDAVYLTDTYAGYFAFCACKRKEPWCIVTVKAAGLQNNLAPDEDFLEQVTRNVAQDIRKSTYALRDQLPELKSLWGASLRGLGTCAHLGDIPRESIKRISLVDMAKAPTLAMMMIDPTITIMNKKIYGAMYQALTRWASGLPVTGEEIINSNPFFLLNETTSKYFDAVKESAEKHPPEIVYQT